MKPDLLHDAGTNFLQVSGKKRLGAVVAVLVYDCHTWQCCLARTALWMSAYWLASFELF